MTLSKSLFCLGFWKFYLGQFRHPKITRGLLTICTVVINRIRLIFLQFFQPNFSASWKLGLSSLELTAFENQFWACWENPYINLFTINSAVKLHGIQTWIHVSQLKRYKCCCKWKSIPNGNLKLRLSLNNPEAHRAMK